MAASGGIPYNDLELRTNVDLQVEDLDHRDTALATVIKQYGRPIIATPYGLASQSADRSCSTH